MNVLFSGKLHLTTGSWQHPVFPHFFTSHFHTSLHRCLSSLPMFGPFPMATAEEQSDVNAQEKPTSQNPSDPQATSKLPRLATPQSPDDPFLTSSRAESEPPSASPTDTRPSGLVFDAAKSTIQPGNAFSMRAHRDVEGSKLPRKSCGMH